MSKNFIERPGVLSQAQTLPIIEPYRPGIVEDFYLSWDWVTAILDQDPERRVVFDTSTQAAMVYCRFVNLTMSRLGNDPNISLKREGRMLRVLISKKIALRFKKLKPTSKGHLMSGNVKTNAQCKIYYQHCLDGMHDALPTEVTFGYTTDKANVNVTGIFLTCPISWYANKWIIPLVGEDLEGTLPFAAPAPAGPTPNQAMFIITPKIKAKTTEGK